MVIPWNALGVVGGAVVFLYDRTKDRRAKAKAQANAMPPAPEFEGGEADIALFTSYHGSEVRHFDDDVKAGLIPRLDAWGLRHVPASTLAETAEEAAQLAALGSFYMVVPLGEGQVSAGETVRNCQESGGVVLGSLSLIAIPIGGPYPMLIAIGGPALEKSANASGEFAVLSTRVEPAAVAKTEPPGERTEPWVAVQGKPPPSSVDGILEDEPPKPAAKPEHANGAAKVEPKTVLGNVFELAKEEDA